MRTFATRCIARDDKNRYQQQSKITPKKNPAPALKQAIKAIK
jgi:hypothetical protein